MKLISVILLLFVALISLSIGNYDINITQNLKFIYAIFNKNILNENDYLAFMIFIKLRLIRIIAAFLVGGALSLCGAIF
ncbi:iron chelate uptake ABC transporter family permease subunit [Campylobacter canadensis]|nr:iron chelate uptake ABC transporter family permease subunit [Campylobacter canadensis]